MRALILEKTKSLAVAEIEEPSIHSDDEVKIKINTVGICGSDIHYYEYGKIGPFVVKKPMILGHEASGTVVEVGRNVKHLRVGDRVCMEPGIPEYQSKETLKGFYNIDPKVKFWATPPVDGCLCDYVTHPASLTFKIPEHMTFGEGAMIEPLSVGMQAATKAEIKPGDIALVYGAGTIGVMCALAALAGGCSQVVVADIVAEKLKILDQYEGIITVNTLKEDLSEKMARQSGSSHADIVFECCGAAKVIENISSHAAPGGTVVLVGMPIESVPFDIVSAQTKELTIKTIFRYANMYDKAINLVASGKINLDPLISKKFKFDDVISAYDRATERHPSDVKILIEME